LFIINEHATILNMPRPAAIPELEQYREALQKLVPGLEIRLAHQELAKFDGVATQKTPRGTIHYLIEEKRHFRHQDVGVIVGQLMARRAALPAGHAKDRLLLLAPHVRPQQDYVLEQADIDYVDLAGNARLKGPGLFVHVQGNRPPKELIRGPRRPQKGWVKVVMALLVRPELTTAPYRVLADQADVALGTVAGCFTDLVARGLVQERKDGREVTNKQGLVALWVQAYVDVLRPTLKERRFQIRTETKQEIWKRLAAELKAPAAQWALTGADAAERRTHFFRAEETEIYVPLRELENRALQKALIAQPATRGGNLLVIEPPGPIAIPHDADTIPMAPDLLVYAELKYRGTEQALEAAEMILPMVLDDGAR
jgi:hypothetical protein